jgi:hypothetical protein
MGVSQKAFNYHQRKRMQKMGIKERMKGRPKEVNPRVIGQSQG